MKNNRLWVNIALLGLCTIGLLGLLLRSKFLFPLPFLNYNRLLEAHFRFTFSGWVTLALLLLMVRELLPESTHKKKYQRLLAAISIGSWILLFAFAWEGNNALSITASLLFILLTYIFSYVLIKDLLKAGLSPCVRWLAISALICLVLSSFGFFMIDYIYFTHSFGAFAYRDSLFTYLHFQYNGFFSLSIMSLLFHELSGTLPDTAQKSINYFTGVLLISVIPSLFLSYLWEDPNAVIRGIATAGSIIVLAAFLLFIKTLLLIRAARGTQRTKPVIRFLISISMLSFALKLVLQCFTIFPAIGNAIFGNRPIIMGFLHLVFLGFVSLFILAFFARKQLLEVNAKPASTGLWLFASGVLLNEVFLIGQGLTTMFAHWSTLFPWLLWGVSIILFAGAALIALSIFPRRFSA